ncbi:MAG: ABC transporter ATP-binding protein [Phycisphaerales bacterium]|nr:ABC transporter ATP-binding protein [Phycisphaerales bacterium]
MREKNQSVVQTAGLTKIFRDFWYRPRVVAVDRLNLDIHRNEVFGLLGPNGSGKTTTIKMLLGLLYPTRGRINILGRAPTDVIVKDRIGYLPEESYLYRFLNARETLDYYGQLFRIPRPERRRRVEQLLEMVGLTRESRRRVGEYSKGMARRIGLAQALINDPDLLILDEPTTGLDPIGTREIKDLVAFLNREKKKTILLCSHLLADVEDVCQRVMVMYGGRTQALGSVRELLSQKDLTQITTDKLDEPTIQQIRQILEQQHKHLVDVSTPSDRLETFFLRIVREAQKTRPSTSGAASGGRIAEFLADSEPQGERLVESLISAAATKSQPIAPVAPPLPTEEPTKEIIEELVRRKVPASSEDIPTETSPSPEVTTETVNRGVIEDLLGASSRNKNTDPRGLNRTEHKASDDNEPLIDR